jgi:hypothetical protein
MSLIASLTPSYNPDEDRIELHRRGQFFKWMEVRGWVQGPKHAREQRVTATASCGCFSLISTRAVQ